MEHINKWVNKIHQGNTLDILKQMPSDFVDTIITSPPYWGLRDYGEDTNTVWDGDSDSWYGQLGLEPILDLYLEHMLQIVGELKRVLKKTGVMFWNHGDSYASGGSQRFDSHKYGGKSGVHCGRARTKDYPQKCMCMQNYRLILKMLDEQKWILRNQIVWYKRNGMPSSATDRLSNKWEPVFMLVKSNKPAYYYNTKTGLMVDKKTPKIMQKEGIDWGWEEVGNDYSKSDTKIPPEEAEKLNSPRARVYREKKRKKVSYWRSLDYFFDLDAIRVPYTEKLDRWGGEKLRARGKSNWDNETGQQTYRDRDMRPNKFGKNPGDIFDIPTQPFLGSHFAVFPKKLISPMIEASCPQWICKECGMPRERITERNNLSGLNPSTDYTAKTDWIKHGTGKSTLHTDLNIIRETIGWTDCGCNAGWVSGVVLDPFIGSGTTAVVAKELGRNFIGIEINPKYIAMAKERLAHVAPRIDKWIANVTISNGMSKWKI